LDYIPTGLRRFKKWGFLKYVEMVINNYDGLVGVLLSYLIDHRTGDRAVPSGRTSDRFENDQFLLLRDFLTLSGMSRSSQTHEQHHDE